MENKNQEILKELQEMRKQVEDKPESPIKERLLKALEKKIAYYEKEEIQIK